MQTPIEPALTQHLGNIALGLQHVPGLLKITPEAQGSQDGGRHNFGCRHLTLRIIAIEERLSISSHRQKIAIISVSIGSPVNGLVLSPSNLHQIYGLFYLFTQGSICGLDTNPSYPIISLLDIVFVKLSSQ